MNEYIEKKVEEFFIERWIDPNEQKAREHLTQTLQDTTKKAREEEYIKTRKHMIEEFVLYNKIYPDISPLEVLKGVIDKEERKLLDDSLEK